MPLCTFGGHAEATWRSFLLIRVEGTENPHYVPHEYVCDIHRRVYERLDAAAPQALRAAIGSRLAAGGYPPPRWVDSSVTFEKA